MSTPAVIDVPPSTIFRTGPGSRPPLLTSAPTCARISPVCAPFELHGLYLGSLSATNCAGGVVRISTAPWPDDIR